MFCSVIDHGPPLLLPVPRLLGRCLSSKGQRRLLGVFLWTFGHGLIAIGLPWKQHTHTDKQCQNYYTCHVTDVGCKNEQTGSLYSYLTQDLMGMPGLAVHRTRAIEKRMAMLYGTGTSFSPFLLHSLNTAGQRDKWTKPNRTPFPGSDIGSKRAESDNDLN